MDSESLRILLIEDNPIDAHVIRAYLAGSNGLHVDVQHTERLSTALAYLSQRDFDAAVVDLNLADSKGLDTLARVHERNPSLPIVVLTGEAADELALQALKVGAEDYLSKSEMEPKLLVRTVRYAIERSGHRCMERQYREKDALYRALFEQSPDGVLLVDPQTAGAIEFNDVACANLGYSREEFACVRLWDYEAQETREQVCAHIERVLLAGEEGFETRHRTKSGAIKDVLVAARRIVLFDRPLLHCIFRDITEWKQAQATVRESEQRYSNLWAAVTTYNYSVKFSPGAAVSTHHGLGCLPTTGYSPDDYATNPYLWIQMVHPDDREMVRQYAVKVQKGEKVPPLEHRILRRDGTIRWIRNTIFHRYDEAGRLTGYDGLVEDISERKRAEQTLLERESHLLAAQEIQSRLWPSAPPCLPGFDIAGAAFPAEYAAGDYFDYLPMLDGSLGLVIGDVSGHGLGPAIVMALTYAHLRSLAQVYTDVEEMLARVNRFLTNETDHFVTLLFGRLTPGTRSFVGVNAGHPPGYVLDGAGRIKARIESKSVPLAVLPDATFPTSDSVTLAAGDMVLLLTDGILEARSAEGTTFGTERMLAIIAAHRERSAREIIEAIHRGVCEFCRPNRPTDDITAIVVKVGPEANAGAKAC
jgi:sigma-B regulation protein RsbU (phosphoserine phosphatase)